MGNVAGQTIIAGRVSGEEIAVASATADSSNFTTTETTVLSVTASLISGCAYMIDANFQIASSVTADVVDARIREDNSTGTEIQFDRKTIGNTAQPTTTRMMTYYTAVATGNKTFVCTGVRSTGTGNIRLEAASTRPAIIRVVYTGG